MNEGTCALVNQSPHCMSYSSGATTCPSFLPTHLCFIVPHCPLRKHRHDEKFGSRNPRISNCLLVYGVRACVGVRGGGGVCVRACVCVCVGGHYRAVIPFLINMRGSVPCNASIESIDSCIPTCPTSAWLQYIHAACTARPPF